MELSFRVWADVIFGTSLPSGYVKIDADIAVIKHIDVGLGWVA